MKIQNISDLPRMVKYLGENKVIEPYEIIEVNPFRPEELKDIASYVVQNIFDIIDYDLYDDDTDDEDAHLMSLGFMSKPQIVPEHGSIFKNINFDNEI